MARTLVPFHVMTKPIGPICNLDCTYCYYLEKEELFPPRTNFKMPAMGLEKYVRDYIRAQPGPRVEFSWQGGEPTLLGVDFFRRAVAYQHKYLPDGWECTNSLQTNAVLLDGEWAMFLKQHGFLIGVSVDGPAHLHDRYRVDKRGRETHADVMRGLRVLQQYGVEHNILCVVNDHNARHALDVYRFFRDECGEQWVQFIPIVEHTGGGEVSERSVPAKAYGDFLIAIFDEWVRRDVGEVFVQIFEECLRAWSGTSPSLCIFNETCGHNLAMEHNGDLYSCDHFVEPEYKLGNVYETDIADLVASGVQERFGLDKRDTLPAYCRRCEVKFMCNGGCPKDRFIRTPDGEAGLNYLCAGYRAFFNHVDPYMRVMADLHRSGRHPSEVMQVLAARERAAMQAAGRNDPCPCGSGRKFKRCHGAASG